MEDNKNPEVPTKKNRGKAYVNRFSFKNQSLQSGLRKPKPMGGVGMDNRIDINSALREKEMRV